MIYKGTFKDYDDQNVYRVTIATPDIIDPEEYPDNIIDPTENADFTSDNVMYFSPDPVHITCERSDLTQLIMISQAEIKLKVRQDMSNILFADTDREISVTVERVSNVESSSANGVLFYGYVDPLQFSQGFAYDIEEIEVNATDPLGALQNLKITDIDVQEGDILPVLTLITKIFDRIFIYDTDKYNGIKTFFPNNINPNAIKVNLTTFFGEDEDDRMTLEDTLNELLKYLGCTVSYEPKSGTIQLCSLYMGSSTSTVTYPWFDTKDDAMDDSATISVDEVYNQIKLSCDIEPNDDDINLLDSDFMYSDYNNYQKYMTELTALGAGVSPILGFKELVNSPDGEEATGYNDCYKIDNFCYVKRNDCWDFGTNSYIGYMGGAQKTDVTDAVAMTGDQSNVLRWLKNHPGKAAFVSFGRGNKINYRDNSLVNNISMTDYLMISIGGHWDHSTNGHITTLFNQIQQNAPICKYTGLRSLNLTPMDENIINYIVLSGKVILNPLQWKTGPLWSNDYERTLNTYSTTKQYINSMNEGFWAFLFGGLWARTVPHSDNEDGAYYTQKWWNCSNPSNPVYKLTPNEGLYGFLDNKANEKLRYTYSQYGDETDRVSKFPILACQLKVGDKWCVERLDQGEAGQGVFEWMTQEQFDASPLKTKGFEKPYFTIGIDPKPGDNLIGHSFDIQNNIQYTMNVDASGTAIPIKLTDKLNGVPEFSILGPINSMWNEIERIHPSFWRHTSWVDHRYWTLEFLDSILISDLKIEFKSNNAMQSTDKSNEDNDLVYVSDMNPEYIEPLEQDLKICTPLTMDECSGKGIKYQTSNSYVMTTSDEPFYGWNLGQDKVKPEHLYIDYYYKQYYKPARILEFNVNNGYAFGAKVSDNTYLGISSILSKYLITMSFPGIANTNKYYTMSMDWSLQERTNSMKCREQLEYSSPFA